MQALQRETIEHRRTKSDVEQEVADVLVLNGDLGKQLRQEKMLRQRSVDTSAARYKNIKEDLDKAIAAQYDAEDALQDFILEGRERIQIREVDGRGKPVTDKFVRHTLVDRWFGTIHLGATAFVRWFFPKRERVRDVHW
jgi:hypothetical protein